MQRIAGIVVGSLLLLAVTASPGLAGMDYQVNFLLGQKMLEKDDWAPLEDQAEFGVSSTFGGPEWPVHIALDLLGSADDTNDFGATVDASTSEFDVGIRKIWGKNKVMPFVGGGAAFVTGRLEVLGISVDDSSLGAWIDGGVFWRLGSRFNIGFEARISRADVTIEGFDLKAGGSHLALILGFGKKR